MLVINYLDEWGYINCYDWMTTAYRQTGYRFYIHSLIVFIVPVFNLMGLRFMVKFCAIIAIKIIDWQ